MLVDAFMFYNELDILELRLETLDKYVDHFVLVEAEVEHLGPRHRRAQGVLCKMAPQNHPRHRECSRGSKG